MGCGRGSGRSPGRGGSLVTGKDNFGFSWEGEGSPCRRLSRRSPDCSEENPPRTGAGAGPGETSEEASLPAWPRYGGFREDSGGASSAKGSESACILMAEGRFSCGTARNNISG